MWYKIINALLMQMKFKRLTTELAKGSLQMSNDEMFVEVFGPEHHVFVVMEMMLVLQYYGAPLQLLFVTFKCN